MRRKILREDILNAGTMLMFSHGYNATGIKDITDEIEIPKGSFYNHFNNKEEFAIEVLENYIDNGILYHEQKLRERKFSPLKRLEKLYESMINGYKGQKNYKLGCLMGNLSSEMADVNSNFRRILERGFKRQEKVIQRCLDEAKEEGEIFADLDTKVVANFILNSWHGALIRMKSDGNASALDNFKNLTFKMLKS